MEKEKKKKNIEKIEIKKLQKDLAECQELKEEYLTGWQRLKADFLNHKKGEAEHLEKFIARAEEKMILEILPIADAFERATEKINELGKKDELAQGFVQMKQQLQSFLEKKGIKEIKSLGEEFNPFYHEAVGLVEKEGMQKDTIVEEIEKGYEMRDRVIRPAKVRVSK